MPENLRDPSPSRPALLALCVVSAGRVGAVLGAALQRAGHDVVAVAAVSAASRERAETLLPGVPIRPTDEVVGLASLLLLAVPDDVLPGLVEGLAATESFRPGQLVAHTSGRHGLAVLEPAVRAGVLPLALHPAMTFTGTSVDLERLAGASFGVTAPDLLRPVVEALAVEAGGEPVWVAEEARVGYHAALAHGANHLVTLVAQVVDLLRANGIESPERLVAPLLSAALDNALRFGDRGLTGPVARGDAATVADHVRVISAQAPDALASYLSLARATADRALANGRLSAAKAEALLEALAARPTGAPA